MKCHNIKPKISNIQKAEIAKTIVELDQYSEIFGHDEDNLVVTIIKTIISIISNNHYNKLQSSIPITELESLVNNIDVLEKYPDLIINPETNIKSNEDVLEQLVVNKKETDINTFVKNGFCQFCITAELLNGLVLRNDVPIQLFINLLDHPITNNPSENVDHELRNTIKEILIEHFQYTELKFNIKNIKTMINLILYQQIEERNSPLGL